MGKQVFPSEDVADTRNSAEASSCSTCVMLGSELARFSPRIKNARIFFDSSPAIISGIMSPTFSERFSAPQALANLLCFPVVDTLIARYVPGSAPCTGALDMFCPRSGFTRLPPRPRCEHHWRLLSTSRYSYAGVLCDARYSRVFRVDRSQGTAISLIISTETPDISDAFQADIA